MASGPSGRALIINGNIGGTVQIVLAVASLKTERSEPLRRGTNPGFPRGVWGVCRPPF